MRRGWCRRAGGRGRRGWRLQVSRGSLNTGAAARNPRAHGRPMIAAGGICDGRGMAAAFALGAEGIQMGTRFVSCSESPVHANYKNAIVQAKETGTLVLNKKSTPCIRAVESERTRTIYDAGLMAADALEGIRQ